MSTRNWLNVRQAAVDLNYCEDTVRDMCARGALPGATKADPESPKSQWRIPEEAVRDFGARQAVARTTSLDHKRRKELMTSRRKAA